MSLGRKRCPYILFTVAAFIITLSVAQAQTIIIAAANSMESSKAKADIVCTGEGDQAIINRAIASLPEVGGAVMLLEGNYDIRREEGKLGGILIERSNVTLMGVGAATKLIQAPNQNTNVIRIIGEGVSHVTIRDLYVDANRDANPDGEGDPDVSHARFEFCGIKAYRTLPGGPSGQDCSHITVMNCQVMNARRLGIMLEGVHMRVQDNIIGNATSDAVEILTGPGEIRGNYMEITGRTHVAIGTDRAENIIISNNIVHVKEAGDADIGIRVWAGYRRHLVTNNVITLEKGGRLGTAMDIRGTGAVVSGNYVTGPDPESPLPLWISGGNTIFTENILENVAVVVDDKTELYKRILMRDNIFENTELEFVKGNLVSEVAPFIQR